MAQSPPNIGRLFLDGLAGDGVVTGCTGKVLRSFSVEFYGLWSMDDDILHLDETVRYADGREIQRHWTVRFDGKGRFHGYDANRVSRLRAHIVGDKVRMVYDRPLGGGAEIAAPRVVMDLSQTDDGGVCLNGRVGMLGLVFQRTRAKLRKASGLH